MTRSVKAAVIGLLLVLIVAAVAFGIWYLFQPKVLIDTNTLSVVRDGSTITVHDLVSDAVHTFKIVRVRRSEGVPEPHRAIDTATISIDTIPHGGLKITDKAAGMVYIVKRKCISMNP